MLIAFLIFNLNFQLFWCLGPDQSEFVTRNDKIDKFTCEQVEDLIINYKIKSNLAQLPTRVTCY